MSDHVGQSDASRRAADRLSPSKEADLDRLCDRFEDEWKRGATPDIAAYLAEMPAQDQAVAFRELLHLEIHYRGCRGERPTVDDYLARFAHYGEIIVAVFEAAQSASSPADAVAPLTVTFAGSPVVAPAVEPLPERIGRYLVRRRLGEGSFGVVYLADDQELERPVAVKVPHRRRIASPDDVAAYLSEARILASLDHAAIVPVYDVGRTDDGLCYVVSKFIEGQNLDAHMKAGPLSHAQSADVVATAAEALHHAHTRGLVHRDVKPANILLDSTGRPYVADFGLAVKDDELGKAVDYAGTPAYMSPEQAKGEGHRVDGRSDIFSLGVVFYEMLCGRRPFKGNTVQGLLDQVRTLEVRPPRQWNDTIPKELERICLKCLSKRASDRYTTARDLADDLWHFLLAVSGQPSAISGPGTAPGADSTTALTPSSDGRAIKIVPKGLRSFDEHDADFFLELLPGPRDREGLPDSIRFWKTRIEETDAGKTFSVGLICGPSGCGKSSLIKAGLLPRLSEDVIAVYVEATADETELRLHNGLRNRCPALADNLSLTETLAVLRRGQGIPAGKKLLIVLDQFEQWLHAKKDEENTELVQALRQCDGTHLQCVVMVRDDFWMAVIRFMRELEIRLVEGQNSAAVDLFPIRHAEKVLVAFGRAFSALPDISADATKEQNQFLEQAVSGLAQESKVVCVRLALFAEMMKGKAWTATTLKEVGGTEGVGVTFLEETFSAATAPPEHRYHQKAARGVLNALLPESGTDIKGQMKSYAELVEASGYASRRGDFDDLIRILDSEIRLITPTDPEGKDNADASTVQAGAKYYELTHDYLVPSLRDWLTRKQRETRRGRAELRLAERAAAWNARPDARHLPSWWEWPNILLFTKRGKWSAPERRLMRSAWRYHAVRFAGLFTVVLAVSVVGFEFWRSAEQRRAETLAESVFTASTEGVPYALANLRPSRRLALGRLRERLADPKADAVQRLHAAYALADSAQAGIGEAPQAFLLDAIPTAPAGECENLVEALKGTQASALPELALRAKSATDAAQKARYAIVALHLGDPQPAGDSLALRSDPIHRTSLIHAYAGWHGDLAVVADLLRASTLTRSVIEGRGANALTRSVSEEISSSLDSFDAQTLESFRSGLCSALGTIAPEDLDPNERQAASRALSRLYVAAPDGGTHSAAGWALVQWKHELPAIVTASRPPTDREWYVNGQGQTMIQLPAGTFTMGTSGDSNEPPHEVRLTRAFCLSDREVTVEQFMRFVDDDQYPATEKPADWKQAYETWKQYSPTPDCPVHSVNWFDAVLYCNWLSVKEGIRPVYARTGEKEKIKDYSNQDHEVDNWRCDFTADGYRLPTEAEWEYACRAVTATSFYFANDEDLITQYGWIVSNSKFRTWPGGLKLPNGRGLFDMHGNLWEWCYDRFGNNPPAESKAIENPVGAEISDGSNSRRVLRGGAFLLDPSLARSANRNDNHPENRNNNNGFRPASTLRRAVGPPRQNPPTVLAGPRRSARVQSSGRRPVSGCHRAAWPNQQPARQVW